MKKLFYLLYLVAAFISCTNESSSRYVSEAISCNSDSSCFQKVDSLLSEKDPLKSINWRNLSHADSVISFHDYSDAGINSTILVLDNIESVEAGEYLIRMGSDDGFRLFVNGKLIGKRTIGRSLKPDSDWFKVKLT